MTALRSFAAAFCTVCVVTGGLVLLCPTDRLGKAVRYVFGLMFLLCVLTVIPGLKQSALLTDSTAPPQLSQTETPDLARQTFALALREAGIEFSQILVSTDNSASDSISITKVTVYTAADASAVRELLGGDGAPYEIEIIAG